MKLRNAVASVLVCGIFAGTGVAAAGDVAEAMIGEGAAPAHVE